MMSERLSVYVIGIVAYQFQAIDGFLTPIQIVQHVPAFHPFRHNATFEQLWGHAFNPQDVRVVHSPGYYNLLAIFLKFHPVKNPLIGERI